MSPVRHLRTLGLAAALAALAACSGVSSPSSPVQPAADDSYVFATITLLDLGSPCRPGIACAPEFYTCDGLTPITVPTTWTVRATTATAGTTNVVTDPSVSVPVSVTGTDTARGTAVAIQFIYAVDSSGNPSLSITPDPNANYADVDTSCTRFNSALNTVSQFQIVPAQPYSMTVGAAPVSGGNVDFAVRNGATLSGGILEGTFDFIGQNRQELGQIYIANVRVQGCFRIHLANGEQGMPVVANPSSPGC